MGADMVLLFVLILAGGTLTAFACLHISGDYDRYEEQQENERRNAN